MKILVSACLLGENCKYNGSNNFNQKLIDCFSDFDYISTFNNKTSIEIIPVCPEILGGLPTPRIPSEIVQGIVTNREGKNVDYEFRLGAERALEKATHEKVDFAVLKANSPSCGFGQIYDGTFSGTKIKGNGVFATILKNYGIPIFTENQIDEIKNKFSEKQQQSEEK